MIRTATLDDVPEIARLGGMFHAQAGWAEIPYNEIDCAKSIGAFMEAENFICLVADYGKIVGMIAGIISPVYFNHLHLSGEELFWYVDRESPHMTGARLLHEMESLAKEKGCQTWQMKSLSALNGDRMAALYERRGYRASERSFIKEL